MSWKKLCSSKLQGGMEFHNFQAFNLAMLIKQGWRILLNPNSFCAKVYKAKYYPNGDVLNVKLGSNPSYARRSIFKALEVIRRGTRWRGGNGKLIHIWEDKWLPTPTTYKVISPPRPFDDFPMVFALIYMEMRRWKVDILKSLFFPFEVVRLNLFNHLLALFHAKFACISSIKYPVFRCVRLNLINHLVGFIPCQFACNSALKKPCI